MKAHEFSILFVLAVAALVSFPPPARAADSCQPVFDALKKLAVTPRHNYTIGTEGKGTGDKEVEGEAIFANGQNFILTHGKWVRLPITAQDVLDEENDKEAHGKASCQSVRTESVNSEATTLYTMHRDYEQLSDKVTEDAQIWISKSTGLPVRVIQDWENHGIQRKTHRTTRYEYGNIRPPM